jgi:anti-anti-sigma regulatory factor
MELPAGRILVGTIDRGVCIRVEGRATYLHGPPLRDFAKEMIRRGHRQFELDLGRCSYTDSTFLGVLVGVSVALSACGAPELSVVRITPRHLETFRTLGIDRFFQMDSPGAVATEAAIAAMRPLVESRSQDEVARAILEAHQMLIEADERNEPRFKDVLQYLREDLAVPAAPVVADFSPETLANRWKQ